MNRYGHPIYGGPRLCDRCREKNATKVLDAHRPTRQWLCDGCCAEAQRVVQEWEIARLEGEENR